MRRPERQPQRQGRPSRLSPRQRRSRLERDRRQVRWVIAVGVAIVLAVIAIPAYGYYASFVAPPRQHVAQVNETIITLGDLKRMTSLYKAGTEQQGSEFDMSSAPFQVLNDMVESELVRQNAAKLGVAVDESEVEQVIRSRFYPKPPEGQQVSQGQLDKEYRESLRQFLNLADISLNQYRDVIRSQLFLAKAQDRLSNEIPRVSEQVYAHWIRLEDATQSEQVRSRLGQGEEFAQVAKEMNNELHFADENGEVGWVPHGALPELEETLFSLEHDVVSGPIGSADGSYFIKVTAGPETREVSDIMLNHLTAEAMRRWVAEQYKTNDVGYSFDSKQYEWLASRVRESG